MTHQLHELHDRALPQLGARLAELLERDEARVRGAEDAVSVAGDNLPTLERLP